MIPGIPLSNTLGVLCLALAAGFLARERERRLATVGLLILGLALAAWAAGTPPGAKPSVGAELGRGFSIGNGGLLLVGLGLVSVAVLRAAPTRLRVWARALGALGAFLLAPLVASFLRAGGPIGVLACAVALGTAGGAIVWASNVAARKVARRLTSAPVRADYLWSAGLGPLRVVLIAGLAATLAGPHVVVVVAGALAATWAAWRASHPPEARPLPIAATLVLLLIPACWLLATIAGPVGLRIATLPDIPMSPAAELLLAPALLLAAWATAGLWPLQRQLPGALVAPAGALLLARVAHPAVLDALDYWRPLTVPLLVLGLWQAASWGRWPPVLAGAAVLAVVGGTPVPIAGCATLLALAFALELPIATGPSPHRTILVHAVSWPLATAGALLVLEEVLWGEVVYSTLGVLALALIVLGGRETIEPSAAR